MSGDLTFKKHYLKEIKQEENLKIVLEENFGWKQLEQWDSSKNV